MHTSSKNHLSLTQLASITPQSHVSHKHSSFANTKEHGMCIKVFQRQCTTPPTYLDFEENIVYVGHWPPNLLLTTPQYNWSFDHACEVRGTYIVAFVTNTVDHF